ncbi:BglG family transcription antiterminator [Sutcliffiella rhizosphaerae]|uniref:Transcriptional regulator MtlR n=1 Tax=Sutcliffiella rhizosphaerae TaxID=2880967 RepID=A0ABM8YKB4_9BACI|nr:BglG family transcription antiterminator [Sutcliffiella rhizosphaerae]CAG9620220.1 Transcriptional regulator MtlR [Sutcliffiella rhizosphaerae]
MYITARERQILEILLSSEKEMTVKDLAKAIDVSTRTIHRDLKDVEDTIAQYQLSLIKKSGVGVQIIGEKENIEHLKLFLFNVDHNQYTAEERQTIILCTLLEAIEPVKLIALANELKVTIATVSNDLNKVEERLQPFKSLTLIRKRGYGVEIAGDETAKRRAMSKVITDNVDEYELLSLIRESIQKKSQQDPISERLLGLVEKKNLHIVERTVDEINKELSYSIADSAYMGLVVHLALAMERILRGENITIDQAYLSQLQQTQEYKTAEKIIEKLEKVYQTTIPKAEIGYITMHLRGAKLRQDKEFFDEDTGMHDSVKARSLISYVEKRVHQSLSDNPSLLQGLVAHLGPALFRINQNMRITNPLLDRIKTEYSELFAIVNEGVDILFPDLDIPEEEVGYLVLHFGSVLLNIYQRKPLHALVVCSTGIGTSKMLATRLQKEIPDIKTCKNVSLFELNKMDLESYDLIISTIRLPEMDREYFIVNPILTESEVDKIKKYIYQKYKNKLMDITDTPLKKLSVQEFSKDQVIDTFKKMSIYANTISTLLDGFFLMKQQDEPSIKDALHALCHELMRSEIVTETEKVINELYRREELGGLGIPGTKLALFHAKSQAVIKPSFTIYSLDEACETRGMDQVNMDVHSVLLLLAPENAEKETLEVLSYVSATIIESDESIALFESQDPSIGNYLATKLNQFFDEKLTELRSV